MSVDIKRGRSLNQGYQKYFGISISPTAKTKHSGSDQITVKSTKVRDKSVQFLQI